MRKLVIGMAMASTALASPALARDGQWYVEVGGGPMVVQDTTLERTDGAGQIDLYQDTGYDFGGLVGYDFGAFRLEAEASFREADVDEVNFFPVLPLSSNVNPLPVLQPGNFGSAGDINSLSFMVNGLLDFGDDDGLQGFVGGGAGVARTEIHAAVSPLNNQEFLRDSDSGFAWQVLAGVRAPLTAGVDIGLRYRFYNVDDIALVDNLGNSHETDVSTHSLMGTLTFNFGGEPEIVTQTCWNGSVIPADEACPAQPVAVAPPPPRPTPPPPPVCNKGPYIVFFEWDQSDITPEAATVLDNAASAYANCGTASVMLAGHTDTSGSMTYNEGLAQRRNASVNEYLNGRGIPDTRISSEAFGETQLRVPTADGVRELQNRRVEVTYGPNAGM